MVRLFFENPTTEEVVMSLSNLFLALAVIILFSILFGGPYMIVAKILGKTSSFWFGYFKIDPSSPEANPWGFFEPLNEGRVVEVNKGDVGRILWHVIKHGQNTLNYLLNEVPLDQTNPLHTKVVRILDGQVAPQDVVPTPGGGQFAAAVCEFRKLLRKECGVDLAAFRFPWSKEFLFRPRLLPLDDVVPDPDNTSGPKIRVPGKTDHARFFGEFDVVTASFPSAEDQVNFVLECKLLYALADPSMTRPYSSPYAAAMEVTSAEFRKWLGQRTALEVIKVTKPEPLPPEEVNAEVDVVNQRKHARTQEELRHKEKQELEAYLSNSLRFTPVIPSQNLDAEGHPILVSVGDAFGWRGLRVVTSDIKPATQADQVALSALITTPATILAQGLAEAKKRKALNEADIDPLKDLNREQAARAVNMAAARNARDIRIMSGVTTDGAMIGFSGETADNTRDKTGGSES